MGNELFLTRVVEVINGQNPILRTKAIQAHRLYLVWEQNPSIKNWKEFIGKYLKLNVEDF